MWHIPFAEKIHHRNSDKGGFYGALFGLVPVVSSRPRSPGAAGGAQLCFRVVTTSSSPLSCVVVTGRALKAVPEPPQPPPASKDLLFLRRGAEGAATSPQPLMRTRIISLNHPNPWNWLGQSETFQTCVVLLWFSLVFPSFLHKNLCPQPVL